MTNLNTANLDQLLGAYLHQDWPDEFESDEVALGAVVESEPIDRVANAVKEIDGVLAASLPEHELATLVLNQIGCYFDPGSIGMTYEAWLKRVRRILQQPEEPKSTLP